MDHSYTKRSLNIFPKKMESGTSGVHYTILPPLEWLSNLSKQWSAFCRPAKKMAKLCINLAEFLFMYQNTAHATTNVSPSEICLGWHRRTRFNFLRKHPKEIVRKVKQKQTFNRLRKDRLFFPGSSVIVRDYFEENKWISGTVLRKSGPVTYHVDVRRWQVRKHHVGQLRCKDSELQQPSTPPAGRTTCKSTVIDNNFDSFEQDAPSREEVAPPWDPQMERNSLPDPPADI